MNEENFALEQSETRRRKQEIYKRELAKPVYDENGIEPSSLEYAGRSKDFLIVPDEVVFAGRHLSHGEARLWTCIFSFIRKTDPDFRVCFPGRAKLSLLLGITPRQTSTLLEGLRRKNLLLTKKRLGLTSIYVLRDPPKSWLLDMHRKLRSLNFEKKKNFQNTREERLNRLLSGMPSIPQSKEFNGKPLKTTLKDFEDG